MIDRLMARLRECLLLSVGDGVWANGVVGYLDRCKLRYIGSWVRGSSGFWEWRNWWGGFGGWWMGGVLVLL